MALLHSNILGEGAPFLILHGFLGMSDNWKTLGKQFAADGFQVHLIDQRNHGRSFHDVEFNYDVLADDVKYYCNYHKLNEVIILGHSMGGKTAMNIAVQYPDLVNKLLVADIAPRYYPVHHDQILNGLANLNFDVLKSRSEADTELATFVEDQGTRQFLLKNLFWIEKGRLALRMNLEVLTKNVHEVGEALPTHANFTKSTLFLRGDRSEYIMQTDESEIKRCFPNAHITTIADAGHWLHAENPKAFYNSVISFIT